MRPRPVALRERPKSRVRLACCFSAASSSVPFLFSFLFGFKALPLLLSSPSAFTCFFLVCVFRASLFFPSSTPSSPPSFHPSRFVRACGGSRRSTGLGRNCECRARVVRMFGCSDVRMFALAPPRAHAVSMRVDLRPPPLRVLMLCVRVGCVRSGRVWCGVQCGVCVCVHLSAVHVAENETCGTTTRVHAACTTGGRNREAE